MTREYLEASIYLKSGGVAVVALADLTTTRSALGDGFTKIEWVNTEYSDLPKLHGINPEDIAAITARTVTETTA